MNINRMVEINALFNMVWLIDKQIYEINSTLQYKVLYLITIYSLNRIQDAPIRR
jgi:hypothetical protein